MNHQGTKNTKRSDSLANALTFFIPIAVMSIFLVIIMILIGIGASLSNPQGLTLFLIILGGSVAVGIGTLFVGASGGLLIYLISELLHYFISPDKRKSKRKNDEL